MAIIDVSVPIRDGMLHYPGDPGIRLRRVREIARGEPANLSALDFGVHTATHVDAPVHFLDGAEGIDAVPLEAMIGPADIVDGRSLEPGPIGEEALRSLTIPDGCERLLLKTRNSELWSRDEFSPDSLYLDESGAREVLSRGIVLVGIDYLSIGDEAAHRVLLGAGIVPIEGLDLGRVEPGRYTLVCLPLNIPGCDGAPARVVLLRDGAFRPAE
jgi:arylformamidase